MIRQLPVFILSGLLFGAGLAVSGMADPQRVRGFLDIFGAWDPTLIFVMCGAVTVMMLAWLLQRQMSAPRSRHAISPAQTERHRSPPHIRCNIIWHGLGYCWTLSRTRHDRIGAETC